MMTERTTYNTVKQENYHNQENQNKKFRRERSCGYLKRAMNGISQIEVTQKNMDKEAIKVYVRIKPTKDTPDQVPIRIKKNSLAVVRDSKSHQNLP